MAYKRYHLSYQNQLQILRTESIALQVQRQHLKMLSFLLVLLQNLRTYYENIQLLHHHLRKTFNLNALIDGSAIRIEDYIKRCKENLRNNIIRIIKGRIC